LFARPVRPSRIVGAFVPFAVIIVAAILLLWRVVLGGVFLPLDIVPHLHPWRFSYERVPVNNPILSDAVQQIYPRRLVANEIIAQGAWPLWNPTILTGTPLLADGQLALFYPPSLLFVVLPLPYAFGAYALLQVVLAGVGGLLFGRTSGLRVGPATVAGLCYMLCGFFLSWLQFPEFSGATAMLPWCFWVVNRACQRDHWGHWTFAGAMLALPLVTQIQIAFYIYVAVGCLVLWRVAAAPSARARARLLAGWCGAVVIALLLSAVQVLPQLALSAEGQRGDIGSGAGSARFAFDALLRLLLPLLDGTPRPSFAPSMPPLLQVPQAYAGILPLLLAVVALVRSRHRDLMLLVLLAAGSFALAVSSPLLDLFIALVPPYRQFADHTRWFVVWGFGVAMLAGLGAQALTEPAPASAPTGRAWLWLRWTLLGVGALLLAAWAWRYLALLTPRSRYGEYITLVRQTPAYAPVVLAAAGLGAMILLWVRRVPRALAWIATLGVIAVDLVWHGGSYNTTTTADAVFQPTGDLRAALATAAPPRDDILYPPTRQTTFLQGQPEPFRILGGDYGALPPNVGSAYGLEDIRGYQSLYLERYNRLTRLVDGKDYTRGGEGATSLYAYFTSAYERRRLLDMLNVAFIVFGPGSELPPRYAPLELVQKDDEGSIYRNPQVLPRAWLVHEVELIADDGAMLNRLADAQFDPATTAVVAAPVPPVAAPATAEPEPTVRYAPNRAVVKATVAAPALLVLSDAYTADWLATVNGAAAPVVRTNYALRGVWLPPGTHDIVFTYRPRSFLIGGGVSAFTLAGLLGVAVRSARRSAAHRVGEHVEQAVSDQQHHEADHGRDRAN
jgi:hypothetical protein